MPTKSTFSQNVGAGKTTSAYSHVGVIEKSIATKSSRLSIAAFIGAPHFLVVHGLWFVLWVVLNTLVLTVAARFDAYPFGLLGIILSVEAIFITGVLMISQNRQSAFADKRAELDYEISVLTHRKLHEIERMLKEVQ